ncbi:hypothetical protein VNO77_20180 [Canavalia gladiata]|uniref:Uncharacterized protein n=1 Tax=Canavalia gladiata TaxID=3824 RepID=A0AAN9LP25_CANGL
MHLSPPGSVLNYSVTEPNSSASHGHSSQVAPGIFIGTFNVLVQVEGVPPEINRIISAVIGSIGLPNFMSGNEGIDVRSIIPKALEEQSWFDRTRNTFGLSVAVSLGCLQPSAIPNSLTTLSQYLSYISHKFNAIVREGVLPKSLKHNLTLVRKEYLSNILCEIMLVISQQVGSEENLSEDHMAQDSSTKKLMLRHHVGRVVLNQVLQIQNIKR